MLLACRSSVVRRCCVALLSAILGSMFLVSSAVAVDAPEKAARYHGALLRRPSPGYLFDRFYNAWLDEDTVENLETFLSERAEQSGSSEDSLLLAFFFAKQGDELKAIEQFQATLKRDPTSADAWYEKAVLEARLLNFETALADLDRALSAKPPRKLAVRIAKLQGQLLVRARRRVEAIAIWSKLLTEFPDDEDLSEDVIELEINEGLFDEAATLSMALIERTKDPYRKVLRQLRLGDIRQRGGDREAAVAIYRATLHKVGTESWIEREILAQIERVFRREDNVSALREEYKKLLDEYPRRVGIRRGYAKVLSELGENDVAIEQFREILKLTPGERSHQEAFIQLLARADKLTEAVKQLETLIEQYPQDPELYVQLSALQSQAEKPVEAEAAVEQFLSASDKSEYAHLRAARLLEQLKIEAAAKKMYARLVAAYPESISAKEAHAAFLYKVGEKDSAITIWKALSEEGDAQQLIRIARSLTSRQEHEVAFEVLNQHAKAYANHSLYLGRLVAVAVALSKFDEAVAWARRRVELAEAEKDLAEAVIQAARVISRAERLVEITDELQNMSPRAVQQTCLLAELLEASGDTSRADQVLAPLAEQGEPAAIAQQVRLATTRREWTAAIAAMRRLIDLPNRRKSGNVRRLVEYLERDFQFDEALVWIGHWKKLSPGSISPWITESRLQLLDGKHDAGIETLRRASIEFPGNTDIRTRLAELYTEAGKLADAQRIYWQQYEETESLDGKIRAVGKLAQLAESQGKVDRLVERFDERRRNNRLSIEPLMALAEIHRVANNYEGRRQALTEASKLKPDDLGLLHQVARIEEQEGDWERARETLERAATLDKTSKTRQRIARLLLQYGNTAEGYAMLYELAGGENSDPREVEGVADAIIGVGDWQQAGEFLVDQLEQHPEDYRLRYLLAITQEEEAHSLAAIDSFVALLGADQEIAGLATGGLQSSSRRNSYIDMLAKIMPPGVVDLIEFSQSRYTAYSYRQQNQRFVASFGSAGRTTRVHMPANVKGVRKMALTHLVSIAQELEEKDTAALLARLETHGIANADLLMAVGANQQGNPAAIASILEDFSDRDAAVGYVVMMGAQRQRLGDSELYQKAFKRFAKPYPQLAIMAAVQAVSNDEQLTQLLDEAIPLMDRVEAPNPMLLIQLCSALGGLGRNQAPSLPDEYRQPISKRVIAWYPAARKDKTYGPWVGMYVLSAVRASGDVTSFVNLLEDEVAQWRSDGSASKQNAVFGRTNEPSLNVPKFPPTSLVNFPPMLLQMLTNDGQRFGLSMSEPTWQDEDLLKVLPQVKDPILRVLLAASIEEDDLIDSTLAEVLAAETPSLDAYLMAAGRAADKDDVDKALALLDKARYLPMTRAMRRRVDGSIVSLVLSLDEMPAEDSDLLELAQGAALRLRHGTIAQQERTQLVSALEELGLTKEAKRLEQKTASRATSVRNYSSRTTPSTPPDRIQKLLDGGKRTAAAKLLSRELLGKINQTQSSPNMMSYMRRQTSQLGERIAGFRLTDDVLAELAPGESKNHRKIGTYAMACEALGKLDAARENFAKALELRPKEDLYRVKLAILAEEQDAETLQQQLRDLSPHGDMMVAAEVASRMQDYQAPLEDKLAAVKIALAYLRARAGVDKADVSWLPGLCQGIGSSMYANSVSINSLYQRQDKETSRRNGPSKEFLKERREIHDALCREMLTWPALAKPAFSTLLASHEAADEVDDEFFDLARDAIILAAKQRNSPPGMAANNFHFGQNNNGSRVPWRLPSEYLVRQCWQKKDWHVLDDEVLPALDTGRDREQISHLNDLRALYECSEDDFLEVANRAVKQRRSMPPSNLLKGNTAFVVIEVWQDRQLAIDLREPMIEYVKQYRKTSQSLEPPLFVYQFLERLAEQDDASTTAQWLERLAELYLGPNDKREDFLSKYNTQGGISSNSPSGDIYWFRRLLTHTLAQDALVLPSLEFISNGNALGILQNAEYQIREAAKKLAHREPKELIAYLESAHMLADLPDFRAHPIGQSNTLLSKIVEQVGKGSKKTKLVKLLKKRPPTLGTRMLLADLGSVKQRRELLEHLGNRLDDLESLPLPQQRELLLALTAAKVDVRIGDKLPKPAKVALDWYRKTKNSGDKQLTQKILSAKRFEELGLDSGQMDEWLAKLLPDLFSTDPELCSQVYFKIVDLFTEAMQRNAVNRYYSQSVATEMFRSAVRRMSLTDIDSLRLVLHIVSTERPGGFAVTYRDMLASAAPLETNWRKHLKDSRRKKKPTVEAIKRFRDDMAEAFGESSPSPLLVVGYYKSFKEIKTEDLPAVTQWLSNRAAGENPDRVAAGMLAAVGLVTAETLRQATEKSEPEDNAADARIAVEPYHDFFLAQLADEATPLQVRGILGMFLSTREGRRLPASVAQGVARVDTELVKRDYEIENGQHELTCQNILLLQADSISDADVAAFAAAWKNRYLRVRSNKSRNRFSQSPYEMKNDLVLARMLSLYLDLGDDESVNQMLRRYTDRLVRYSETLAILIRAGWSERTVGLARGRWSQLSLDALRNSDATLDVTFDEALASKIPEFVEGLGHDELRFFYQAALSCLDDPQPKPAGDFVDREARLLALAKRFSEVEFRDSQLKAKTLLMFRSSPAASDLLLAPLREAAENIDLVAAINRNDNRFDALQKLSIQYVGQSLRAGDLKPLQHFVSQVTSDKSGRQWQLDSARREGTSSIVAAIASRADGWTIDQCAELAPLLRTLGSERIDADDRKQLSSLLVLISVRASRTDDLASWYKKLESSRRSETRNRGATDKLWEWAASASGPHTPENQAERLKLVSGILRLATTFGWVHIEDDLTMGLRGSETSLELPLEKLLTDEEILELGAQLAKTAPAKGATWILLARRQQAAGQHLKAAESWRQVRKVTKSKKRQAQVILNRVAALIDGQEPDTARKELVSLAFSGISGETKVQYDRLLKRIKSIIKQRDEAGASEDGDQEKKVSFRQPRSNRLLFVTSGRIRPCEADANSYNGQIILGQIS